MPAARAVEATAPKAQMSAYDELALVPDPPIEEEAPEAETAPFTSAPAAAADRAPPGAEAVKAAAAKAQISAAQAHAKVSQISSVLGLKSSDSASSENTDGDASGDGFGFGFETGKRHSTPPPRGCASWARDARGTP